MSGTAIFVDVSVVIFTTVDKFDLSAELFENLRINYTSGTIGAVHADVEAMEVGFAEIICEMFQVEAESFGVEVFAVRGGSRGEIEILSKRRFNGGATLFGEFGALRFASFEDFNSVVCIGVVAGGDVDGEVEAHLIKAVVDARGGKNSG